MKYSENGGTITLEMSFDDYQTLLMMLGASLGTAKFWMTMRGMGTTMRGMDLAHPTRDSATFSGDAAFWKQVDLVNRMNAGNPNFTPYDIPDEYRTRADV